MSKKHYHRLPLAVRMTRPVIITIFVFFFLSISFPIYSGGENESAEKAAGELSVFVSIVPQKFFAERVGGIKVNVTALVPAGRSPHTYDPSPKQVLKLGKADLYFTIDVDFEEAFVPEIRSGLPNLEITDSREGIELKSIGEHRHGEDDEIDPYKEKEEEHPDPHVWLDPLNGKKIAANIRDALIEMDPEGDEIYEENYRQLAEDIDELHRELSGTLAPVRGETFLVFHPAFGYFADRYDLDQEAVEIGGNEPSPGQLSSIIKRAKEENVRVIFVQPQFSKKSAQTIADAIGGAVVPIDPLAENWLSNLRTIAKKVREGLGNEE